VTRFADRGRWSATGCCWCQVCASSSRMSRARWIYGCGPTSGPGVFGRQCRGERCSDAFRPPL